MDLGIFYVPPTPQSGKAAEKTPTKPCDVEVYEKKIKLLEKQRKDVSLACLLSYLLLILFCHRGKSVYFVSYMFSGVCFAFWLLTGAGGEQAVGHSVERHEVTV